MYCSSSNISLSLSLISLLSSLQSSHFLSLVSMLNFDLVISGDYLNVGGNVSPSSE